MNAQRQLAESFSKITTWMRDNDAPLLADNLAPAASSQRLDEAEATLGFALHPELRALWSLHDGQVEEQNGFYEWLDLLSANEAVARREDVVRFLSFMREEPEVIAEVGMTEAELESDAWIPIACRDSDSLAVNAESGRVFRVGEDWPPFQLEAQSVVAWASAYAARVVANGYRLEEGFGDYFLERRDFEA